MTPDRSLVTRKLALIAADLERLERVATVPRDRFLADAITQAAAERLLERVIGRMIDVNYHLITDAGQPPPTDYFASFQMLADIGVLDRPFADRLAPAAGLRNRLVHEYEQIDPARVFDALGRAGHDIRDYSAAVERYLGDTRG